VIGSSLNDPRRRSGPVAEEVRAEMVANVWKIVVADGDEVAAGDTIAILESMKMEIPVEAADSGTVTLHVAEGDVVQEGDLIAEIE
jgi:acetyl-CoA carboxylase biotin carboxyl carrier protein